MFRWYNQCMLTQGDITKLVEAFSPVFTTKEDLRLLEDRIHQEITVFRNEILDRIDKVYKELIDIRLEQKTHFVLHERLNLL